VGDVAVDEEGSLLRGLLVVFFPPWQAPPRQTSSYPTTVRDGVRPRILAFLEAHDPMALRQAREALRTAAGLRLACPRNRLHFLRAEL
jgi:hypothetical protein